MADLKINELVSGDIILYHGFSWLSKAIRLFDGTNYNHASLYLGDQKVLEAIGSGVIQRSIEESIAPSQPVIIMRLQNRPPDMTYVVNKALEYEGNRYGYEQLLFLALICSTRNVRLNNFSARFFRKLLEKASSLVLKFTNGNREALICSELVYRSYDEAVSEVIDPYTIRIIRNKINNFKSGIQMRPVEENSLISILFGLNISGNYQKGLNSPVFTKVNLQENPPQEVEDKELEILFEEVQESYVKEDYDIDDNEIQKLQQSLNKFVTASTLTDINTHKNLSKILPNPIARFLAENANFVTPGDLYARTSNLQYIGNLK